MTENSPEEQAATQELIRRWEALWGELRHAFRSDESLAARRAKIKTLLAEVEVLQPQLPPPLREFPQKDWSSLLYHCTDRARKVFFLAVSIARSRSHEDVEPADLFDALLLEGSGVAAKVMKRLNYDFTAPITDRSEVDGQSIHQSAMVSHFSEAAADEASSLNANDVGTEHQLLALLRLHPELVPNAEEVRAAVLDILGHSSP